MGVRTSNTPTPQVFSLLGFGAVVLFVRACHSRDHLQSSSGHLQRVFTWGDRHLKNILAYMEGAHYKDIVTLAATIKASLKWH
jgi:hypothetical protein